MTHFLRSITLVLMVTICARAIAESPGPIKPANVEITGRSFEIQAMRKGTQAFRTRSYVWSDVPDSIDGLLYTQMAGGGTAVIHLKVQEAGKIYVAAAANQMLDLKEKGWTLPTPDRSNTFTYTDQNLTLMIIMSREVAAGEELDIPQMGWTGIIVFLSPKQKKAEARSAI